MSAIHVQVAALIEERNAARAQRDRMLAALQVILQCVPDESGGVTLGSWELGKVLDAVRQD